MRTTTPPAGSSTAPTLRPGNPTAQMARYGSLAACLVTLLTVAWLLARAVAVLLGLAAVLADRTTTGLDRWLAAVPLHPLPVRATATRTPTRLPAVINSE